MKTAGGFSHRSGPVFWGWFFVVAVWFAAGRGVQAHPANLNSARLKMEADGVVRLSVNFDVLAFALNDIPERVPDEAMNELLNGPVPELERILGQARQRFARGVQVQVDGRDMTFGPVDFPTAAEVGQSGKPGRRTRLPLMLEANATGRVGGGAHRLNVVFPESLGGLILTLETPGEEPVVEPLRAGERSRDFPTAAGRPAAGSAAKSAPGSWLAAFGDFVVLGVLHIIPRGLDHILFVLGLFFLSRDPRWLLWQVTAFTVAHSISLALALYGVLRLSPAIVEPVIALSIVLVAVDNLRTSELRPWRVALVFGFGLIHGLGFAGALQELGLERARFLTALAGFNLGVELGQLLVVLTGFVVVGWMQPGRRYRRWVALPGSVAIGVVAAIWTFQRI